MQNFSRLNHFEKFSLTPSFDLDLDALENKYLELQRQFHPDISKGCEIYSIDANEAYKILKNPVKRAIYLLKLNGINIDDDNCRVKPDQETLINILELREEIAEADDAKIKKIRSDLENEIKKFLAKAKENFAENNLDKAAQDLIKVKYFDKTIFDLKNKNKTL